MRKTEVFELFLIKDEILKTSDISQAVISKVCFVEYVKKSVQRKLHMCYTCREMWGQNVSVTGRFSNIIFSYDLVLYLKSRQS